VRWSASSSQSSSGVKKTSPPRPAPGFFCWPANTAGGLVFLYGGHADVFDKIRFFDPTK
jgi:hypothetical protein